jgi:DNA-directed RNA polymerase specialized sigma24 family protein
MNMTFLPSWAPGPVPALAFRMLGSMAEAEDAVQETWLRLSRSQADDIDNLGGWLTTVAARICLDTLRARAARKEEPLDAASATPSDRPPGAPTRNRRRSPLMPSDSRCSSSRTG